LNIEFTNTPLAQLQVTALAVYAFEGTAASSRTVEQLPAETRGLLGELEASGELTGKAYECTLVHRPAGLAAQRLLVVGGGKKDKFNTNQLRRLAGSAVRYVRARGLHDLAWFVGDPSTDPPALQAMVEGAILADYDADRYRTERNSERRIDRLDLATGGTLPTEPQRAAVERGHVIAEAQNFTRNLVNEPSNRMTPRRLAQQAADLAAQWGLQCDVFGPEDIQRMKMGAFWSVAQGSEEPPRLIVLRYSHLQAPELPVVGLIGKGITFDKIGRAHV